MEKYITFIKNAWENFTYDDIINEQIRSEILESWIRCKKYNVNPMGGKGKNKHSNIKELIDKNMELIKLAKPVMESVYKIVEGSSFAMILADKDGYILEVIGDEDIMDRVNELNFLKGELWREKENSSGAWYG